MESASNDKLLTEIYELLGKDKNISLNDLIEDKKKQLEISSERQLSEIIGVDRSTLKRILDGEVQKVDIFSILKINQFLGIGIEKLIQLYVSSLKPEFIKELEDIRKANYIISNFDIGSLKKQGFLNSTTDYKEIENRITTFFGIDSIFEYQSEIGYTLFSKTNSRSHDKMRDFWVRCAHHQFKKINNPHEYLEENLKDLIPKIRSYTRYEESGFLTVIKALYNAGVTVIVQSYLSKTQVRGATFLINKKPCIVITDYRKSYDTIWFCLLHELYHILYDMDDLKSLKYHLTGESNIFLLNEEDADYFAREILFPEDKREYIKQLISIPHVVEEYAKVNKVHTSIIYGFYCWDEKAKGNDVYKFYSKYIPKSDIALKAIKTYPLQRESINTEVEKIKEIINN